MVASAFRVEGLGVLVSGWCSLTSVVLSCVLASEDVVVRLQGDLASKSEGRVLAASKPGFKRLKRV